MSHRLLWAGLGAGATLTAQACLLLVLLVIALLRHDGSVTTMAAPRAVRFAEHPGWPVGTCLVFDDPTDCALDHDAEVVAILDPGREDDEGRRRWVANSSCAREVAEVAAAVTSASITYAAAFPDDDLQVDDSRVLCLLVAADDCVMTGSWTAGDLEGPHPPPPFE